MPTQQINQYEQIIDGNAYNIVSSISSNNLVVSLKRSDGINDPSDNYPISIQVGTTVLKVNTALSVTVPAAAGDIFSWDGGKIQDNDAQLFVYLVNNNGTPVLGVSPCPTLTTVATNYYDGSQTGVAGHTNIVIGATRNATNICQVIGRLNVNQADNNNWQSPTTAKVVNNPTFETDLLNWTTSGVTFGGMTFTITTLNIAQYQVVGNMCAITGLYVIGTTGGSASAVISLSMPIIANYPVATFTIAFTGAVADTGTPPFMTGTIYTLNTYPSQLFAAKPDFSNYGLGTNRIVIATGRYEAS